MAQATTIQPSVKRESPFLTEAEAAEFLQVTTRTMKSWRKDLSLGLPYLLVGRQYRYRPDELIAWAERLGARDRARRLADQRRITRRSTR